MIKYILEHIFSLKKLIQSWESGFKREFSQLKQIKRVAMQGLGFIVQQE